MRKKRLSLSVMCLSLMLGGQAVQAEVIMDQNFDNTGTFTPGITGFVGSAGDAGGRWGLFSTTLTRISDAVADSGTQSLIATRGDAVTGRTDETVATDVYEIAYSINRATGDSAPLFQVGNSSSVSSELDLAAYIQSSGIVHIWAGGWTATAATAPVGEWTRIRMLVDSVAMSYDLFVTPEGGSEAFVQTVSLAGLPADVNSIRINPQGVAGSETYVDDLYINTIPEPTTAGLLGLSALALIHRRRCN